MTRDAAKSRFTRVGAYGLVIRDDHILLCRLSAYLGFGRKWTLPGGGVEFGEDPEDAMIREVEEETGLHVASAGLAGISSVTGEARNRSYHAIRIVYHTELRGGELRPEVGGTVDDCDWHALDSLDTLDLIDLVDAALPLLRRGN